jgi:hypothetical protein
LTDILWTSKNNTLCLYIMWCDMCKVNGFATIHFKCNNLSWKIMNFTKSWKTHLGTELESRSNIAFSGRAFPGFT